MKWALYWNWTRICGRSCLPCKSLNSLPPGGFHYSLKLVNVKLISTINIWSIFCEIAIRWMPQYLTDHLSTLVQVMAWCRQATSHYLRQCWSRSLSPYNVTRPQWVKSLIYSFTFFILSTYPLHTNHKNDESSTVVGFIQTLSTTSRQDANNFVVTGGIGGCHNDNLRCHKWRKIGIVTIIGFRHN